MIGQYAVQQFLELIRFEDYWQRSEIDSLLSGKPLDRVTVVFLSDTDAIIPSLRGGSIDGASITGSQVFQLDTGHFDIVHSFSAAVQLLALNNAYRPLDDIRVRQAINFCIDIREIIDTAFYGMGEPSGSPLIPGLAAYYETSLADPYPVNIEAARALLAEAGYGDNRQKLALEITVPSNYTMHIDTAQVIVSQLSRAGIEASIKLVDWSSWLSDVYRGRRYQATIISLDSSNASPMSFLSRYYSGSGSNFINFNNGDFDRVYNNILSEMNDEARAELYREAQRIIVAAAASVYIQDIYYVKAFRGGAYGGNRNYPLYVIDFASIYGTGK
jgi:peptide/nickel transport system substrate-binding protein